MLYITRAQKVILAVVVVVLVIVSGTVYIRQEKATEISLGGAVELKEAVAPSPVQVQDTTASEEISVYICGAVANPGVIKIKDGTRLEEAIKLLGGTNKEADLLAVNLAYKLADEDMIYIPKKGEKLQGTGKSMPGVNTVSSSAVVKDGKVNINTASQSELDTLEGIGPSTAKAIIQYREQKGPFKSIEEIKEIKGIGDKKYDSIKDSITVQ